MFSLVDEQSFEQVEEWVQQVETYHHGGGDLPVMILVGNKTDLVGSSSEVVEQKHAQTLKNIHNFDDYLECSVAEGEGVREVFHKVCALLYKRHNPPKTPIRNTAGSSCCDGKPQAQNSEKLVIHPWAVLWQNWIVSHLRMYVLFVSKWILVFFLYVLIFTKIRW